MNQKIKLKLSKLPVSILAVIVLLTVVFSYAFYKQSSYGNDQEIGADIIEETYQEIKVEKLLSKTAIGDITLSAVTEPLDKTKVSAKTSGRIALMYVDEGDFVTVGQKICIIEAMKVMKEITSTLEGKIVKVLVQDNHPVEYGQPIFEVETEKEIK